MFYCIFASDVLVYSCLTRIHTLNSSVGFCINQVAGWITLEFLFDSNKNKEVFFFSKISLPAVRPAQLQLFCRVKTAEALS